MKRRLLSMLLSFAMILSLVPAMTVRAEEIDESEIAVEKVIEDENDVIEETIIDEAVEENEATTIPNIILIVNVSLRIGDKIPSHDYLLSTADPCTDKYYFEDVQIQEIATDGTIRYPYGENVKANTTYKIVASLKIKSGSNLIFNKNPSGTLAGNYIDKVESWSSSGTRTTVSVTKKTEADYIDYGIDIAGTKVTSDNMASIFSTWNKDSNGKTMTARYDASANDLHITSCTIDGDIVMQSYVDTYTNGVRDLSKRVTLDKRDITTSGDVTIKGKYGITCYTKTLSISSGLKNCTINIEGTESCILMFGSDSLFRFYGYSPLICTAKGASAVTTNAIQAGTIQAISENCQMKVTAENSGGKAYATSATKIGTSDT